MKYLILKRFPSRVLDRLIDEWPEVVYNGDESVIQHYSVQLV